MAVGAAAPACITTWVATAAGNSAPTHPEAAALRLLLETAL